MGIKSDYIIRPILPIQAQRIVVANHYLHRRAPCSQSWGLFRRSDDWLAGVIMYGTPSSAPLRSGIAGKENALNVIELTRLWVHDSVGKNAESYLIGNTLEKVYKPIIVSFADASQGHIGVVYQATNWLYTGLSAKRTNWTIEGVNRHSQTIGDRYTAQEIRDKYGEKFSLQKRPRKHRYIYIQRRFRKRLIKQLRYKLEPYPNNSFTH